MKRKKHPLRNFLIFLLLVVVVGLSYYVYEYTSFFIIKDVHVLGNLLVDVESVENYIGVDEGLHYFKANQFELEEKLKTQPQIKNCVVKKIFPNGLDIKVIERVPIVAIYYSETYLIVDDEMIVIDTRNDPGDLYVIKGYDFDYFFVGYEITDEDSYILKQAIDLAVLVIDSDLNSKPPIVIEEEEILLLLEEEIYANFGRGKYIEERFNEMLAIYNALVENGNNIGVIDVRFDAVPVFRPLGDI